MPKADKTLLPLIHAGVIQRLAVAGILAGAVAACSSDTMRFGDNPFSNPFNEARSTPDNTTTGSLGYTPTMAVQSAPLAPPQQMAQPVAPHAPAAMAPAASNPVPAVGGSAKGWTAQGGSSVYVGTADTLATLSGRYNVPSAAILAANGLSNPSQIAPGQKLIIPVYNPAGASVPGPAAVAAAPVSQAVAPAASQRLAAPLPVAAPKAAQRAEMAANSLNDQAAKLGQGIAPKTAQAAAARQVVASLPTATTDVVPQPAGPQAAVAPKPSQPAAQQAPAAETASAASNEEKAGFRWPARGRVISGFGSGNEGINIAVPEGTPVKAAEGGVVAYAGNELKGYGNLVLIRHDNGWVSAYANNGELKVKRGDSVARGQTIAKSGQSGNVTSPQLHFELRKGSKPVDPVPHLAGL